MYHGVGYAMGHVSNLEGGHQINQSQTSMYKVVTREKAEHLTTSEEQ